MVRNRTKGPERPSPQSDSPPDVASALAKFEVEHEDIRLALEAMALSNVVSEVRLKPILRRASYLRELE